MYQDYTIQQSVLTERKAFIERHGGEKAARKYVVSDHLGEKYTGHYLFPDGARLDENPMAQNLEPPEDELKRCKLIGAYKAIIHEEAAKAVAEFRNAIDYHFDRETFINNKGSYQGPSSIGSREDALTKLRGLVQAEWAARKALQRIGAEVRELEDPAEQVREEEQMDHAIARCKAAFLAEVERIVG